MIRRFIFLVTLTLFFPSLARADVFMHPIKNENLGELKDSVPSALILRGDFEQTKHMKGLDKNFVSQGRFIFVEKKGLYWQMQKPFLSTIIFAQNGLMTIEDDNKKLLVTDQKPILQELSDIFQAIFASNPEKLKDYFDIFFIKNNQNWTLGLKPKNDIIKNIASKITILGKDYATQIVLEEQSGDSTIIKFRNVSLNPKLTKNEENYFKF